MIKAFDALKRIKELEAEAENTATNMTPWLNNRGIGEREKKRKRTGKPLVACPNRYPH